jgi:DNA polymerase III epsilon subunit-like protein
MNDKDNEVLISVDVEASGPIPGEYSMLSIGACRVDDWHKTFECELKPINANYDPAAMEATGLKLDDFKKKGLPPVEGMKLFNQWLKEQEATGGKLVFVGFNAPFDWSFVNYYFLQYLQHNPFGFTSLDIKAYYMGVTGCRWSETSSSQIARDVNPTKIGDHNPLHDAIYQAELFTLIQKLRSK